MKYLLPLITGLFFCFSGISQSIKNSLVLKNKSIYCIKIIDKSTNDQTAFIFKGWPNITPIYRIVFSSNNAYTKFTGDGSVSIHGKYSISGESIILKSEVTKSVYKIINRADYPFITLQTSELDKNYLQYCILSGEEGIAK